MDTFNKQLVAVIMQSAEESIPKGGGSRRSVPWWDVNCSEAVTLFRQLKKHHTLETLIQYKRSQACSSENDKID